MGRKSFADKLLFWKDGPSALTRIHALWTLEGLHALDKSVLLTAYSDADPQVRKAAVELGEPYLKKNDNDVLAKVKSVANDPSIDVRKQVILSLQYAQPKDAVGIIQGIVENDSNEVLTAFASRKLLANDHDQWKDLKAKIIDRQPLEKKLILQGGEYFSQLCATCHGKNGTGVPTGKDGFLAPPLADAARVNGDQEVLINILLHGLSGPIEGKQYPDVMPSLKGQTNEYIASVLSYIRTDLGNNARVVQPATVQKVREETKGREKYWTLKELQVDK